MPFTTGATGSRDAPAVRLLRSPGVGERAYRSQRRRKVAGIYILERAPRLIKSRAAGHAPVPGLQRSTRAHRLLARPEPAANSEFFAFLCRPDTARCQHLCHLVHLLPGGGGCSAPPIFFALAGCACGGRCGCAKVAVSSARGAG